jgi:predicted ATPase/class 3 adenylate cyclase
VATLPRGTLAFLLSDIEGSTRLAAAAGARFPELLDAHFALMRAAIEAQGGTIVSTEGDSVFAVLPTAGAAVRAAAEAQRGLGAHRWPDGMPVKVRIGVHVGEAVLGGRDYTGIEVHKAARIMAAGWGEEIICSAAVQALVGESLEDPMTLRDLGVHTLRDIAQPERLYQVVVPGLRAEFPPPRTESAAAPTNLPMPLTRFVGRTRELDDVEQLVAGTRLVTLTGPGGTGKTRLAIETGRASLRTFPDGVFFVALDAVRDPDLVIPQVAQTLGLVEEAGRSIDETLAGYLANKRLLLILDNLEQVISAAPRIAALLGAAPNFVILGSSREPLGVAGETIYSVPPLSLPVEPGRPTAEQVAGLEAVELFVERARVARPDFALTDDNAWAVAAICRRVDGLPLAIELAAARLNVLAPAQILERLDHRLTLLAGSRRDVSDRQRTLRGAIDWSHDLLAEHEKAGFRRFAVFSGGADLDAALAVLDPDGSLGVDPIDLISALVARSLLRTTAELGESRFAMLETIREYALEQLAAAGEDGLVRDRHSDFYARAASAAADVLVTADRDARLDRLDREMPNFRAAIAWSITTRDVTRGAQIAFGLKDFWRTRIHLREARRVLDDLLAVCAGEEASRARVDLLTVASELAAWHSDYERSTELSRAAIADLEALGDRRGLAQALSNVGWGNLAGRPEVARDSFKQSIAIARELGDETVLVGSVQGLSLAEFQLGDMDAATRATREAVRVAVAAGDHYTNAFNMITLGLIDMRAGDSAGAARQFASVVREAQAAGALIGLITALESFAILAFDLDDWPRGVKLAAVADRMRGEIGGAPSMAVVGIGPPLDRAREHMDTDAFEQASAEARTLSTEDAVDLALSMVPATP